MIKIVIKGGTAVASFRVFFFLFLLLASYLRTWTSGTWTLLPFADVSSSSFRLTTIEASFFNCWKMVPGGSSRTLISSSVPRGRKTLYIFLRGPQLNGTAFGLRSVEGREKKT